MTSIIIDPRHAIANKVESKQDAKFAMFLRVDKEVPMRSHLRVVFSMRLKSAFY
jgi:hypothetical protein